MLPSHSVSRLHTSLLINIICLQLHMCPYCVPVLSGFRLSELLFALDLQYSSRRSKSEKTDSADDWPND